VPVLLTIGIATPQKYRVWGIHFTISLYVFRWYGDHSSPDSWEAAAG